MKIKRYQAAGGIVLRGPQVLLLRKRDRNEIVLPKGHIEPGETPQAAAVRETQEETGYRNLRVLADLGTLRADFIAGERHVIRDETYYLMELVDEARIEAPDHDDAAQDSWVFEPHWALLEQASARMTFEPARTFVRRAAEWVQANR